jgi:uncharacterized protein (TIGR00255 family)
MASNQTSTAVKSMTGFAKVSGSLPSGDFDIEVKAVNHRFFEVTLKGLPKIGSLERDVKSIFQEHHSRGRIDITVNRRAAQGAAVPQFANEAIDSLIAAYVATCKRYGAKTDDLSNFIGAVVMREGLGSIELQELSEAELALVRELMTQASSALFEARRAEGIGLVADIEPRLGSLSAVRQSISAQMSGAPARLKERLLERVSALAPEVRADPERLALEVALLSDRVDVSEELARLEIHLTQFSSILKQGHKDGVGRMLDFITQEIGRELNTIGSKAQDAVVQGYVVQAKAELERIREQVQNVE